MRIFSWWELFSGLHYWTAHTAAALTAFMVKLEQLTHIFQHAYCRAGSHLIWSDNYTINFNGFQRSIFYTTFPTILNWWHYPVYFKYGDTSNVKQKVTRYNPNL